MDVREFQIWWNDFMQLATLSDIFRITELYSFINFNGNCSCWTSCTLDIASTVTGFSSICLVSPLSPYRVPFQIFLSLTAYICLSKGCNILIIPANLIAELSNFRKKNNWKTIAIFHFDCKPSWNTCFYWNPATSHPLPQTLTSGTPALHLSVFPVSLASWMQLAPFPFWVTISSQTQLKV